MPNTLLGNYISGYIEDFGLEGRLTIEQDAPGHSDLKASVGDQNINDWLANLGFGRVPIRGKRVHISVIVLAEEGGEDAL
jgi:hypothetical protein